MNKAQLIEAIQKPETNDAATEATTEKPVAKSHMYIGAYIAEPSQENAGKEGEAVVKSSEPRSNS